MKRLARLGLAVGVLALIGGETLGQDSSASLPGDGALPGPGILAEMIRTGEIDVGEDRSLALGDRFHRIHTRFMSLQCASCHNNVEFPDNIQFLRREEFPVSAYPGAADRAICMGCHRGEDSLATTFYHVPKP